MTETQLEMLTATCRSCSAPIIWAVVAQSGRRIPLDADEVPPKPPVAAYNPESGRCRILTANDVAHVDVWAAHGVTYHKTHFATCPQADRWRVTPEAEPA